MKMLRLLIFALLSSSSVMALSFNGSPAVSGYCWNASGNSWVLLATSSAAGNAVQAPPPGVALYGSNGSGYYPLSCDASGNLTSLPPGWTVTGSGSTQVVTAPGTVAAGASVSAPMVTVSGLTSQPCIGTSSTGLLQAGTGCGSSLTAYGTIYGATSWSALTGFAANGITPTITSNALVFTGGSTTYADSFDYIYNTDLMQWNETAKVTVGTPSSTSYGIGLGARSNSAGGFNESIACAIDLTNTGTSGQARIALNNGSVMATAATSSALSFSAGDSIQLTCNRNYDTYTATARNVTTSSAAVSVSYQYQLGSSWAFAPQNSGRFTIYALGGTQTVTALNISSQHPVGLTAIAGGDSKTIGQAAGYYINSWSGLLQSTYQMGTNAGGAEVTADFLARVPELIALHPKSYICMWGRNDVAFGISPTVYEANYSSAVSQLIAAGITVYHILPLFETSGIDYTTLKNWIVATYPAANIITVSALNNSAYLAGDGVHPNQLGNLVIAQAVQSFLQGTANAVQFIPQKLQSQQAGNTLTIPTSVTSADGSPSFYPSSNALSGVINPGFNYETANPGYSTGAAWLNHGSASYVTSYQQSGAGGWKWCTYPAGTPLTNTSQLTCTTLAQGQTLLTAAAGSVPLIIPSTAANFGAFAAISTAASIASDAFVPGVSWWMPSAGYQGGTVAGKPSAWGNYAVINYTSDSWAGILNCTYPAGTNVSVLSSLTCIKPVGTTPGGMLAKKIGAGISAVGTIAPVSEVVHITSNSFNISTITAPAGCTTSGTACQFTMIPDAAFVLVTGGNIAIGSTATVGRAMTMTYDPATALWYPSY